MDEECWKLAEGFVDRTYVQQAKQAQQSRTKMIKTLLSQRKLPEDGWDNAAIEAFVMSLSSMDSNNFEGNVGVGEREARIYSSLVASRHYFLGHGIGRSGDLNAVQPKAAGSSLLLALTNKFALDSLKIAGMTLVKDAAVVPLATGMTLSLCMQSFHQQRPTARFVIWPRIDQKTCLKAIATAGLVPIVIENSLEGDELRTNITELRQKIIELGPETIVCIASTTSCFAPRSPERVVDVAKICSEFTIPHLINNAYGVQCPSIMGEITSAMRKGRVDLIVQSTDKNYMVPVGGAVISTSNPELLESVSKLYPGRASMSPILDLFITLLSMGASGFRHLLKEREEYFQYTKERLLEVAQKHGGRVLNTPNNPISMAMSVGNLCDGSDRDSTYLGSMLFQRNCSGCRIVSTRATNKVAGIQFEGYGAHTNSYPVPYLTVACAIGASKTEIDTFMGRLDKVLSEYVRKRHQSQARTTVIPSNPEASPNSVQESEALITHITNTS